VEKHHGGVASGFRSESSSGRLEESTERARVGSIRGVADGARWENRAGRSRAAQRGRQSAAVLERVKGTLAVLAARYNNAAHGGFMRSKLAQQPDMLSSLAGVFNACSTLFTVDIYEKLRPKSSQHEIVRMGRIATTIMVVIAMCWIPVVKGAPGLCNYLQSVQG